MPDGWIHEDEEFDALAELCRAALACAVDVDFELWDGFWDLWAGDNDDDDGDDEDMWLIDMDGVVLDYEDGFGFDDGGEEA